MSKMISRTFRASIVFALIGLCACAGGPSRGLPIDQVPMYGGMDRSAYLELKIGDEKLIADTVTHYGSRRKASMAFVNTGFTYYKSDDLANAMRRFNQAWLLDPDNPEVYWGFASVLYDRQKFCQGLNMVELGLAKGPIQPGFLPDAALLYTGCGRENTALSEQARSVYYARSDELFERALHDSTVSKEYTLHHWARAMYARERYDAAWAKVAEYRRVTGKEFPSEFLANLRRKMPEPR